MQRDERQAKTEADLERSISNRLKTNSMMSANPMSAANQQAMATDVRMNYYGRTKNMVKYRELSSESAKSLMAISDDSLNVKNAVAYQRFMDEAKAVPDSIKASPNFMRCAALMKTMETQQVANKLNSLAWTYFETMTEPADLNKALAWSGRSLELERNPALLDTYAQPLGKLGRKAEAIQHEEAMAKAKAAGESTEDYEKTLALLKQ